MGFVSVLTYAHRLVQQSAARGGIVVDATAGNGVDTLFLAHLVGAEGQVHSFDIQPTALERTRERIVNELPHADHVYYHLCNHAEMNQIIPQAHHGSIAAVMFNLGYLPGSDKVTTTNATSTIPALQAATELLRPFGVITTVLYTGHEGGSGEATAVETWAQSLPKQQFDVLRYQFMNRDQAPYLIAIMKK